MNAPVKIFRDGALVGSGTLDVDSPVGQNSTTLDFLCVKYPWLKAHLDEQEEHIAALERNEQGIWFPAADARDLLGERVQELEKELEHVRGLGAACAQSVDELLKETAEQAATISQQRSQLEAIRFSHDSCDCTCCFSTDAYRQRTRYKG